MTEAVRTTASSAAIWTICVVAVACLAFWLIVINYADRHPYVRQRRPPEMPGPVLGGIHPAEGGRSVAPDRELPADLRPAATREPAATAAGSIPAQREAGADQAAARTDTSGRS